MTKLEELDSPDELDSLDELDALDELEELTEELLDEVREFELLLLVTDWLEKEELSSGDSLDGGWMEEEELSSGGSLDDG